MSQELHFGLIRPIGVDADKFARHLTRCCETYGFDGYTNKVAQYIDELTPHDLPGKDDDPFRYYTTRMDAGDSIRESLSAKRPCVSER